MYTRWYSQSVQVEPLFRKLRKGCQGFDVQFGNVTAWVGGVVGIIAALYLTLVFFIISAGNENNPHKKPPNPNGIAVITGIGFTLCAVGGGMTWLIISGGNRRKRKRILAFDDAINKYDIKSCGNELLEGDYGIPLFHTVELEECPGKRLWAWLCGNWKDDEFAWLQGGHLVDPLLRTLGDNEVLNLGLRVLGGRQASRVNRLRQAGFDVVVFSEELNLPDIILGHHQIYETSYTRKAVQEYAQPLPGIPATSFTLWGASSDHRGTSGIYGALADLLNSRHCLIQVIGGRVVVFLNCFIGWDSELVSSLKDVERELDFAHTVFQRLKLVSQAADPNVAATLDTKVVSQAFKPKGQFRPKVGVIIAGMCLAMFGGLGLLGAVKLQQKMAEENSIENIKFEEIDAKVVKRGFTRGKENPDGSKSDKARPWIAYSYKFYGESFKTKEKLCDEFMKAADAKKMALAYKKGKTIKVWVDPANPDSSALDAKVLENRPRKPLRAEPEQDLSGMLVFGSFILLAGLGLIAFGFLSGRAKVVVPEIANLATAAKNTGLPTDTASNAESSAVGQLASAQYFKQQPTGILD